MLEFILGSGFVATGFFHVVGQDASRRDRRFELMYGEYREYVRVIQEEADRSMESLKVFQEYVGEFVASASTGVEPDMQAFMGRVTALQQALAQDAIRVGKALEPLRLICSESLLVHVEEYAALPRERARVLVDAFQQLNACISKGAEPTMPLDGLIAVTHREEAARSKIIAQMRVDIHAEQEGTFWWMLRWLLERTGIR